LAAALYDAPSAGTGASLGAAARPVVRMAGARRVYARGNESVCALDGVSLEVFQGELMALLGPSGCGKSTALNLIAGVDVADEGSVRVAGLDPARASEAELVRLRRETVGVVFQAFHLMPNLTVAENVALPLALAGRRDPARVRELLGRVGLDHRAGHYPSELSGGEQQRTAIARALVHRPALLVADEPTGNLDSASGAAILALLDELRREQGAALVLATHDERIAARADRVVRMRDGRVIDTDR
jgi:putative ABC transport system ATP-binding protein